MVEWQLWFAFTAAVFCRPAVEGFRVQHFYACQAHLCGINCFFMPGCAAPAACSAIMQRQFRINCSFVLPLSRTATASAGWWRCHFLCCFTEKMRLTNKRKKQSGIVRKCICFISRRVQRSSRFNCSVGAHLRAAECFISYRLLVHGQFHYPWMTCLYLIRFKSLL